VEPRLEELSVLGPDGFYRLAFADWGPVDATHVVLCVHGVTRNGRDFDALATSLAKRGVRVVAPDLPGRGRSDWLSSGRHYDSPVYLAATAALIAHLGIASVDWVGTSLGGYIGMQMAALPNNPIRRLVLNDFGGKVSHIALQRIARYLRDYPAVRSVGDAERYLRDVLAPFGALTDAQWRHIAECSVMAGDDGALRWHHDPKIAHNFALPIAFDVVLWHVWDRIECPVLAIRGEESDLLTAPTLAQMQRRGASAKSGGVTALEWPRCGHAPSLMADEQVSAVADFLLTLRP
jgi:pimeloyl-ACP methyl ester carboxylesterase